MPKRLSTKRKLLRQNFFDPNIKARWKRRAFFVAHDGV